MIFLLAQREVADSPRWTCAVEDQSAPSLRDNEQAWMVWCRGVRCFFLQERAPREAIRSTDALKNSTITFYGSTSKLPSLLSFLQWPS